MTHWIAGEWVQGQGEAFTSLSPYNQEVIWQGNGVCPMLDLLRR